MSQTSAKFIRLSHLNKLRQCEQVAAVCYRLTGRGPEFLLVQTRGGRWTFPKGSTEPGLTHAQAAALEAFEEAGVHGRIEEASFTRYAYGARHTYAHLCEVLRQEPPQEFGRNPTWFSAGAAKRRLRAGRLGEYAAEIGTVIERALTRIEGSVARREMKFEGAKKDALRKVQFEAGPEMDNELMRRVRQSLKSVMGNESAQRPLRSAKVLQLSAPRD